MTVDTPLRRAVRAIARPRARGLLLAAGAMGLLVAASAHAQAPPPSPSNASQIDAGRIRFASQCGFCHGRDAEGGETGPDLTRSPLVVADVAGEKIAEVVRNGRPDKGMPPQSLSGDDLAAIVAFLHDARARAASQNGGRRSVAVDDLQTGNAEAGRRYFFGAGGCAACHQVSGTFATVGGRYQGLPLLLRMLYPRPRRGGGPSPSPATVTVTTASGETITGRLAYRDEFTIGLTDARGWYRSWPVGRVRFSVEDPLQAHADQLGKYTDTDMHDVLAYLQTLR